MLLMWGTALIPVRGQGAEGTMENSGHCFTVFFQGAAKTSLLLIRFVAPLLLVLAAWPLVFLKVAAAETDNQSAAFIYHQRNERSG